MTCKQLVASIDYMFQTSGMLLKSDTSPAGKGGCVAQGGFKSPFLTDQDR